LGGWGKARQACAGLTLKSPIRKQKKGDVGSLSRLGQERREKQVLGYAYESKNNPMRRRKSIVYGGPAPWVAEERDFESVLIHL